MAANAVPLPHPEESDATQNPPRCRKTPLSGCAAPSCRADRPVRLVRRFCERFR